MRNPYWAPEYMARRPSFNDRGAMRLNPDHSFNRVLAGWWLMNERGGLFSYDSVGNAGATLTTTGIAWVPDGLYFDGTATAVVTTPSITTPATCTVCFEYYQVAQVTSGRIYVAGTPMCYVSNAGYLTAGGSEFAAPNNAWNRVVLVFDGTNCSAYVNDVLVLTEANTSAYARTGTWTFGNRPTLYRQLKGTLRQIQIINRCLTSKEAISLSMFPFGTLENPRFLVEARRTWFIPAPPSGGWLNRNYWWDAA